MGRIKGLLEGIELTQEDIEQDLYNRYQDELEYEEWLQTEGFVEYVNGEIDNLRPRYSESDIMGATRYASKSITINPSEVGKDVYDMLFSEKIEEYLSLHTQRI
jgi:hypothetical protein